MTPRGQRVEVVDFPDGRLEVRYKGGSMPYRTFDRLRRDVYLASVFEEPVTNPREVWFQRTYIGGWYPIHWKGFVLLIGGVGLTLLLAAAADFVAEHHGPHLAALALGVFAFATGATVWIVSLLHSQAWKK